MHKAKGAFMGEMGFQNDDTVMKLYEQWQGPHWEEPEWTTWWSGTVGGVTNI